MFTRAPVAIRARPNSTSSRVCSLALRAAESSVITLVPMSSSTPFSSYHPAPSTYASSRPLSPRR